MLLVTDFAHQREETNASGVLVQSLQSELPPELQPLAERLALAIEKIEIFADEWTS